MRKGQIARACWTVIALIAAGGIGWTAFQMARRAVPEKAPRAVTRAEFLSEVEQGHVAAIVVEDGRYVSGVSSALGPFQAEFRVDKVLAKELRDRGIQVRFERGAVSP